MERMMPRYDQQSASTTGSAQGAMGGGWGSAPPQWDAAQLAREQALRLYNQQMQQAQRHPQQQPHMRNGNIVAPQDLGYEDAFNPFGWDAPHAAHPMQNQYSSTQFNRNPAMQQDRQHSVHLSVQPRHAFNLEPRHRDVGSGDLASAMSLPNSSGTEGRVGGAGGVSRGLNKRKGGRSKKAPPNDSNAIQRCLEVMEQLLEEEDAEPFAEPVDASALGLHDYHQVIRRPMDLGTIKKGLMADEGAYSSSAEVLKDVQQVWTNCRTYNDEDDPIIDMCDNMERFFYQAWKEASLPLPPGAGPTLSRTRPKASTGPAWQDEQQGQRGNKRKRHDAQYEELGMSEFDDSMPAARSVFTLPESGPVSYQKRRKGGNPTSTGTASSHQGPPGPKKKTAAAAAADSPVLHPPPPVQLSAQEAEKNDREAVAAWESLQKQRTKAQHVIQAAQDAVRKLHEAQAALEDIRKAAATQEAAQAAAEALHPWPPDARLVPDDHPRYPPAQPQILHPDVAALGSYFTSLPGSIQARTHPQGQPSSVSIHTVGAGAPHDSEGGAAGGSWGQTSTAGVDSVQQSGESEDPGVENDSQEKPGEALHISGWQRRLQSAVPQHELHQVIAEPWAKRSWQVMDGGCDT
ncbi:hypothetical protein ABBQ38_000352 [Trebouxia sp. C0009 RCD-2024]